MKKNDITLEDAKQLYSQTAKAGNGNIPKGSLAAKVMSAAMRNQNATHAPSSPALFKSAPLVQKEAKNPGAGRRTPCEWCVIL